MSRALFHCLTLDLISTNPLKCRHQHWLFQPAPKSRPWLTLGKIDRKVQQSFLSSSLPSSSFLLPKPAHLLSNPYQRLSPEKFVPDSGKTELFRVIVVSRNVFYVPPQHFAATDLLIIIAITINTVNQSLNFELYSISSVLCPLKNCRGWGSGKWIAANVRVKEAKCPIPLMEP